MKNILFVCLIILHITLSSCEREKIKPIFTKTQGKMAVRILNKNDESNTLYSSYQEASLIVHWASGNNNSVVSIMGDYLDNPILNPIGRGFTATCIRDMSVPTSCYKAIANQDYQVTKFFRGDGFGYDSHSSSLDASNINENLIFTKDDTDSLVGNFRVKLRTVAKNSIDTIIVEGKFSYAKNGVFINPLK